MSVLERETPGLFDGVPDTDYHGADWAVSSTTLKTLFKADAQTAKWNLDHPGDNSTFAFGRFFHSHVLEGGPMPELKPDGRTKAGKAKAAELAEAGVPVLSASELEMSYDLVQAGCEMQTALAVATAFVDGMTAMQSVAMLEEELKGGGSERS